MKTKPSRWHCLLASLLSAVFIAAPLAAQTTETVTFIHTDIAGSPVAATDEAGNVIWRENYRPYGERTVNPANAAGNRQFFHGKASDADTGLSYFGARYYDPVVGRFMGADPQGFDERNLHSFNRYAYGNNNPYKFIDPDGASPLTVFLLEVAKQTGVGYGLGVAADAISQAAAFGQVNWAMAATSSAAVAGGEAGLLSGTVSGGFKAWTAAQTARAGAAVTSASNRALHDAYKNELRAAMEKPVVSDKALSSILDKLYRPNGAVGSGSTAAAVRQELATGRPVGGAFHSQKASDSIVELQRWLGRNPTASPGDRAAAENLIIDMKNALGGR